MMVLVDIDNKYDEKEILSFLKILESIVRSDDNGYGLINNTVLNVKFDIMSVDKFKKLRNEEFSDKMIDLETCNGLNIFFEDEK